MLLAMPEAGLDSQPPGERPTEGQPPRRASTLHCGYVVAEDGAMAALAWTDSVGELAHGELLDCDCDRSVNSGGQEELCEDVLEATTRVRLAQHL